MFDADNGRTDDLSIPFPLGGILSSNLGPEDVSAMKNFELMSSIDFYLMGDVWAFNDGSIVPIS